MKKYRLAAILLGMIIGITSMTGCGGSGDSGAEVTPTPEPVSETNSVWDKDPVAVLGDIEISYRELMIYLQSTKQEYEQQYGSEVWGYALDADGTTIWDFVREMTLEQLIYLKIVCAQAEPLNVSLTEDEVMDINDYTEEYMDYFTEDEIEYFGITEELIRGIYTENLLAEKIYETITLRADTEVADEDARQVKVYQIFVQTDGFDAEGNQLKLTDDELAEKKQKASDLLAGAKEAEDFKAYAQANTEDTAQLEETFGRGDRDDVIVNAAFALQKGEMSGIIEAEDGYYILYCVEETDEAATAERKEEIIAERQKALFEEYYDEWSAEYEIVMNDEVWKTVTRDPYENAEVEVESRTEEEE
ncbi:MAG: peptidyl-prolyl cis-trans isomerase [Lachnospiraceae bacterium]|nr:peptidyl-prolyl cis-trans isomerase [Lachnospiraceae bacterium]